MKNFLTQNIVNPSRKLSAVLARLHRDERGAEGLEKLLIVAAVVLPLLGVLIIFRDRISEWVGTKFDEVEGTAKQAPPIGGATP